MSTVKSTTSPVPGNGRLTPRQIADVLEITVDQVMRNSAKGGRFFSPSFPPMHRGTFAADDVAIYKQRKDDLAKPADASPATSPPRERRSPVDRRAR